MALPGNGGVATRKVAMVLGTLPAVIEATAKGETGGPFKITQVAP